MADIKVMMKEKAQEYLNGSNQACPHCGSPDISGGSVNIESAEAVQGVSCAECGEDWNDIYKLAAICNSDGDLIASKAIAGESDTK